mgnify:CR=1 FL=1
MPPAALEKIEKLEQLRFLENGYRMSFTDTGRGIPSHDLPELFEPRFRTAAGRVHLGWGLVTASHIADEHGGSISVESEEGEGSTFSVVLPRRAPESRG